VNTFWPRQGRIGKTIFITLEPGDITSTGTPEGIVPIYPEDVMEAEIEKIGILRNPVNPVRNSSRCDSKPNGVLTLPAYRQAVRIILKSIQWCCRVAGHYF